MMPTRLLLSFAVLALTLPSAQAENAPFPAQAQQACSSISEVLKAQGLVTKCLPAIPPLSTVNFPALATAAEVPLGKNVKSIFLNGHVYKDLNAWERAKIVTSAFLEPERNDKIKVAYFYPAKWFLNNEAGTKLQTILMDAKVDIAVPEKKGRYIALGQVKGFDEKQNAEWAKELLAWKDFEKFGVISSSDSLFGFTPEARLVSQQESFVVQGSKLTDSPEFRVR